MLDRVVSTRLRYAGPRYGLWWTPFFGPTRASAQVWPARVIRVAEGVQLVPAPSTPAPVGPVAVYDGSMSHSIGSRLDERLLALLAADDVATLMGHAIAIATLDAEGRPHPALLSYGEVRALSAATLRLATWDDSTTTENLRRRGVVTLYIVEAGLVAYLKAHAREIAPPRALAGLARFEATIEDVLLDEVDESQEEGARVTSGIRFEPTRRDRKLGEWKSVHTALSEPA